jgi:hypothetical protein
MSEQNLGQLNDTVGESASAGGEEAAGTNLDAEVRVAMAMYLMLLNQGVMTSQGALLEHGMNMNQIANQAEVSVNYAIKTCGNLRKQGMMRNRKEDGRLLVKLDELEEWLQERGAPLE